jgi:hypothetical protein
MIERRNGFSLADRASLANASTLVSFCDYSAR